VLVLVLDCYSFCMRPDVYVKSVFTILRASGEAVPNWIIAVLLISVVAPGVYAGDGILDKAPFGIVYFDVGGSLLHARSSASAPTQSAANCLVSPFSPCPEQFSNAGGSSFAFGLRPLRYLQLDGMSIDIISGFGGRGAPPNFECTGGCAGIVNRQNSNEFLITTGARGVLPLYRERLVLSAGAGFAFLQVNSRPSTQSSDQVAGCNPCQSFGQHKGPTEIAEVMYFVNRHIGIGFHVRGVQTSSSGLTTNSALSNAILGTTYKERFFLIGAEVSIRFPILH
jgi:hypothetical protein